MIITVAVFGSIEMPMILQVDSSQNWYSMYSILHKTQQCSNTEKAFISLSPIIYELLSIGSAV